MLELIYFNAISRDLKPDLWLSLHDITPRVYAKRQAVYCHNPSPFYSLSWREALHDPKFMLFNLFYKYLYRINIKRNYAVVVQQDWLRMAFFRMYHHSNIIVAHPALRQAPRQSSVRAHSGKYVFLYPVLPRVFKNIEVLCSAAELLPLHLQAKIEIRLTLDGNENAYAKYLVKNYGELKVLRFIGRQNREEMAINFAECDTVLFPSKLETWGLPISEAKALGKSLLVADLPYAHETVGSYADVSFLPANDIASWAKAIELVAAVLWDYDGSIGVEPAASFAPDWPHLWALLTDGL
jgi:glycosyltransferase involved in cell wall biosynthesis